MRAAAIVKLQRQIGLEIVRILGRIPFEAGRREVQGNRIGTRGRGRRRCEPEAALARYIVISYAACEQGLDDILGSDGPVPGADFGGQFGQRRFHGARVI